MLIKFELSGGYGGLFVAHPLSQVIDTDQLPQQMRDEIIGLIGSSGILDLQGVQARSPTKRVPDVLNYRITIKHEGVEKSILLDDTNAPLAVRPLLKYLQALALKNRMQDRSGKLQSR